MLAQSDPDVAFEAFDVILYEIYDANFPLRHFKTRVGSRVAVWFDDALKRERRLLDSLSKRLRATNDLTLKDRLKECRACYRKAVKRKLRKYHNDIVQKFHGNPRKLWQHLSKCMGRTERKARVPNALEINGKLIEGQRNIADAFCEYFSTIGHSTTSHLLDQRNLLDHLQSLQADQPPFSLNIIEPPCIVTNARKMKADLSGSINIVPSKVIKQCIGLLVVPLCHIFNRSILSKVFPKKLKDTTYIPVFKGKGEPNCPTNYRPIAITSFIAKLFERCVVEQFAAHLEANKFFSSNQFGFRPQRSTNTALCSITNYVASRCEGGNAVIGVFLDVAKAFDCVAHTVLFDLMRFFGVTDDAVGWFKSYLADRYAVVSIQGCNSSPRPITLGIPQGSVLGPFIFIFYLNALLILIERNCPCLHIVTYADDTTLLYSIDKSDVSGGIAKLNEYLAYVHDLFCSLRLAVNAHKTRMVLFKSEHCRIDLLNEQVLLDGVTLNYSETTECLGLIFSSDLKWREHFFKISKKCYSIICTFARLRRLGYSRTLLIALYKALLEPVLFYGVPIWGNTYLNTKRLFQTVQNDALRAIYGVNRHQSVRFIFKQQNVLDLRSTVKLKIACLMYKAIHLGLPLSFSLTGSSETNQYELRSNSQRLISQKFCRTVFSEHSPEIAFVKLWNSIPVVIRESVNPAQFKRKYLEHLLESNGKELDQSCM